MVQSFVTYIHGRVDANYVPSSTTGDEESIPQPKRNVGSKEVSSNAHIKRDNTHSKGRCHTLSLVGYAPPPAGGGGG